MHNSPSSLLLIALHYRLPYIRVACCSPYYEDFLKSAAGLVYHATHPRTKCWCAPPSSLIHLTPFLFGAMHMRNTWKRRREVWWVNFKTSSPPLFSFLRSSLELVVVLDFLRNLC